MWIGLCLKCIGRNEFSSFSRERESKKSGSFRRFTMIYEVEPVAFFYELNIRSGFNLMCLSLAFLWSVSQISWILRNHSVLQPFFVVVVIYFSFMEIWKMQMNKRAIFFVCFSIKWTIHKHQSHQSKENIRRFCIKHTIVWLVYLMFLLGGLFLTFIKEVNQFWNLFVFASIFTI